jgi:hypothetical protein
MHPGQSLTLAGWEHAGLGRGCGLRWLLGAREQLQCLSMMDFTELASAASDPLCHSLTGCG